MARGYHGGVLWGNYESGVFSVSSRGSITAQRAYPNELTEVGFVSGMDDENYRHYDDVAKEALELASEKGLSSLEGVVCVAGKNNVSCGKERKIGDPFRSLLPDDDGNFGILYWEHQRKHPFLEAVLAGKFEED